MSYVMGNNIFSNAQQVVGAYGAQQAQNSMSFSQQAAQQYNAVMAQQQTKHNTNRQTYAWVWNGEPLSITEFAQLAYGDSPQRTMFLLKYSDNKEMK